MFDSVKAEVAFSRFIAFGVNARDVERTIRSAVAATDTQILVDDDRAAFLLPITGQNYFAIKKALQDSLHQGRDNAPENLPRDPRTGIMLAA